MNHDQAYRWNECIFRKKGETVRNEFRPGKNAWACPHFGHTAGGNEICPYCGRKALVHCADYDYFFACTACGHRFEFDGEYTEELAYYLASKQ